MEWIEIAAGDEGVIDEEVLAWSGHADIWGEHGLDDDFSVVEDVLDHCRSARVEREAYEHGAPGMSGIGFTVFTNDPDELKTEVAARIEILIAQKG